MPPAKKSSVKKSRVKKPAAVHSEKYLYFLLFSTALAATLTIGSFLYILKTLDIPSLESVMNYRPAQATLIYDKNGQIVDRMFTENRTVVSLDKMSRFLPFAFVAAEDGGFFEHGGISFFSMLRALVNNLRTGERGQGGSTITQQVAKMILLTPEKTYIRKIREAILAWRIDTLLSKNEILTIYLNQVYLGEGAYGVETAAQIYFGKSVGLLNLSECSLLAGLPQAPSRYSLFDHPKLAGQRQKYVLNRMYADGYISAEQAREAYDMKVSLSSRKQYAGEENGYYLEEVKKRARAILGQPLQRAGVKIYTYLDSELQKKAQQAVDDGVAVIAQRQATAGNKKSPQAALVALESKSGKVRALVGGVSFEDSPFNRATQARRPAGSTFKPFLYSAALNKGWQINSRIMDKPLSIKGAKGKMWSPKNYNDKYMGEVTLDVALSHSLNSAAVRLMHSVGYAETQRIAKAAGIEAKMPNNLSLSLGSVDISPLQLTAAYTIFADDGIYHEPRLIEKIVFPSGRSFIPESKKARRVLAKETAQGMRTMLGHVVGSGTGQRVSDVPGVRGGKTGTSDQSRDAWFIGYTDYLTTGVWVGYDLNQPMAHESGGRTAAPIWREFMK